MNNIAEEYLSVTEDDINGLKGYDSMGGEIPLTDVVYRTVLDWLRVNGIEEDHDLYAKIQAEVDHGFTEAVMHACQCNQSKASRVSGMNRGTLRKKARECGVLFTGVIKRAYTKKLRIRAGGEVI